MPPYEQIYRYLRKVFLVVFMSEVNLEIHKPPLRPPASTERVVEEQVEGWYSWELSVNVDDYNRDYHD